ncbi:glycine betaine ABC transporter substrate-binding protein [Nocardia sp. XZ_19_385]|uniref:glycine betaine ABC transporter substrate-binding protein n=1 Tax=Nocardia sp. XZ_19_385 TaxID=2769488 RepID=UPI0028165713|nr:glycine betaine ABC transporter substrate-binding protein [Nocardia sp. XZ_19_385]
MPRRMLTRVLIVAVAAMAVACGDEPAPAPDFVVGAGDSAESGLLAEIYAGALARTGLPVSVKNQLGDRAGYLAALDAGAVSLVGEHNGELLAFLDSGSKARTPAEVTQALNSSLPQGLVVADAADGTDMRPRVLIPVTVAERDQVRSIAGLEPRCAGTAAGAAPVPAVLRAPDDRIQVTGCDFSQPITLRDAEDLRAALLDGRIQAGLLTGPAALVPDALAGLTVLTDDDYALRAQNVLPVLRKGSLDESRLTKLNYVAGELTTEELVAMLREIRDGRTTPGDAARTWLDAHAL